MSHRNNYLLSRTSDAAIARLRPRMSTMPLVHGASLAEAQSSISKVYFPHSGVISCVVQLLGGRAVETGMIGKDGVFGASQARDHKVSLNFANVQVQGEATVVESGFVNEVALEFPEFRKLIASYDEFFLAHVQQTAACNAAHSIHARICKWMLRMNDLVGDEFDVTQEFLAELIAVRRTSVSASAKRLQDSGIVSYSRGHIRILSTEKLRHEACECNDSIQSNYTHLFGNGSMN